MVFSRTPACSWWTDYIFISLPFQKPNWNDKRGRGGGDENQTKTTENNNKAKQKQQKPQVAKAPQTQEEKSQRIVNRHKVRIVNWHQRGNCQQGLGHLGCLHSWTPPGRDKGWLLETGSQEALGYQLGPGVNRTCIPTPGAAPPPSPLESRPLLEGHWSTSFPWRKDAPEKNIHHRQYYMGYPACHPSANRHYSPCIQNPPTGLEPQSGRWTNINKLSEGWLFFFFFLSRVCMRQVYQAFAMICTPISSEATECSEWPGPQIHTVLLFSCVKQTPTKQAGA